MRCGGDNLVSNNIKQYQTSHLTQQFATALCHAKTPNEFIVNGGVFWTLVRAYDRLQRFQIRIKTLAIRIRYFFSFATLVMQLIHVVPDLFVPECHLRVARRCVQVIQHVRHGRNCGFIWFH
jgi:hypothetical protein